MNEDDVKGGSDTLMHTFVGFDLYNDCLQAAVLGIR
jgi:hypothetical protein